MKTYSRYALEYLRHGDLDSIVAGLRYLCFHRSHPRDRIVTSSMGRFFCRKSTNDFQYANYAYEWKVKKLFQALLTPNSVYFDIGSGIGEYSILAAREGLNSFAFEPIRQNFNVLNKNIRLNHMDKIIHAFNYGLGKEAGALLFQFNPINTGASGICLDPRKSGNTVQVRIRTLDQVYPELNLAMTERFLIKVDVESMELQVLDGAARFIHDVPHQTWIIEKSHVGHEPLLNKLNQLGNFHCYSIDRFNLCAEKI